MTNLLLPPPGIRGDYEGACLMCFVGTDTGVALQGEPEWIMSVLMILGFDCDSAIDAVSYWCTEKYGSPLGTVPDHDILMAIRLCGSCTTAADGPPVGPVDGGLPVYVQDVFFPDDE